MSKIVIELDTETKDCSLKIDGKEYSDVSSISIYKYYGSKDDSIDFCATLKTQNNGSNVYEESRICAYADLKNNEVSAKINDEFILATVKKDQVKKEIKLKKHWSYN